MPSTTPTTIKRVNTAGVSDADDLLATEEPMEIRLQYNESGVSVQKNISVTMRTPGNDEELTVGFLYTEGIIASEREIRLIKRIKENNENILCVVLQDEKAPDIGRLERNFYTTSSCGVCGKASIEAVRVTCNFPESFDAVRVPASVVYRLPDLLRKRQDVFENTGGLHACAIFGLSGDLLLSREDVGRHNALDKLIGAALSAGMLPLDKHVLMLSGRISFELMQKAVMAGIKIVAAVGAPSSLAVEIAEEWGITLIGFLRGEKFNIYSGAERILI